RTAVCRGAFEPQAIPRRILEAQRRSQPMSNAFGVAAVTALLRDMLNRRLTAAKEGGIVNANASVSAQPPDRVPVENGAESCLNLFLYEVSPNTGWANQDLASRDSEG